MVFLYEICAESLYYVYEWSFDQGVERLYGFFYVQNISIMRMANYFRLDGVL